MFIGGVKTQLESQCMQKVLSRVYPKQSKQTADKTNDTTTAIRSLT